jgi:hypothetical protein
MRAFRLYSFRKKDLEMVVLLAIKMVFPHKNMVWLELKSALSTTPDQFGINY